MSKEAVERLAAERERLIALDKTNIIRGLVLIALSYIIPPLHDMGILSKKPNIELPEKFRSLERKIWSFTDDAWLLDWYKRREKTPNLRSQRSGFKKI